LVGCDDFITQYATPPIPITRKMATIMTMTDDANPRRSMCFIIISYLPTQISPLKKSRNLLKQRDSALSPLYHKGKRFLTPSVNICTSRIGQHPVFSFEFNDLQSKCFGGQTALELGTSSDSRILGQL
jgi:hypothetical protein